MLKKYLILLIFITSIPLSAKSFWGYMKSYVPFVELFLGEYSPYRISNYLLYQYYYEFKTGRKMKLPYNYDDNDKYSCFPTSNACYNVSSKYYTIQGYDLFDYKFPMKGLSPFYNDYRNEKEETIVLDGNYRLNEKNYRKYYNDYTKNFDQ